MRVRLSAEWEIPLGKIIKSKLVKTIIGAVFAGLFLNGDSPISGYATLYAKRDGLKTEMVVIVDVSR